MAIGIRNSKRIFKVTKTSTIYESLFLRNALSDFHHHLRPTLQQAIFIIGSLQGFILFALLISDSRVTAASRILGVQCMFLAVSFLHALISTGPSWLTGLIFFLPASYGALSYLYCRSAISNRSLSYKDLLHLLPILSCYLLNADTLFAGDEVFAATNSVSSRKWQIQVSQLIVFTQAFFYILITVRMISLYYRQASNSLASFNPATFKWLSALQAFSLVIWSFKAVLNYTHTQFTTVLIADLLIVIMIYFIAFAQWRNSRLFTIDQWSEDLLKPAATHANNPPEPSGALDVDTRAKLFESVKEQIESQALYRESELTLASLADVTGLSSHHLSEVLNQHEGKNFHTFINAYRISDVCERLKQGDTKKIIDIAMDAGFSSKSAFNAIFKKFTGTTPSQYRKGLNT